MSCGVNSMSENNSVLSNKEGWIENLQEKVLNGEASSTDVRSILDHGQVTKFRPVILLEQMPSRIQLEYGDHVVAVLKHYSESGKTVNRTAITKIVEGKCGHCGSNRLKVSIREPEGIACTECPVCEREDMSGDYEFNYEIGGGSDE